MTKRLFTWGGSFPSSAVGAGAGASNTGFMAMKGGSATAILDLLEVACSGTGSASTVGCFAIRYSSTLGVTPTALAQPGTDGPMNSAGQAIASPVVVYFAAATAPVISNAVTLPTLQIGINTFGGIYRWNASPTQQWTTIGNA